jgi:hypothetical protein
MKGIKDLHQETQPLANVKTKGEKGSQEGSPQKSTGKKI